MLAKPETLTDRTPDLEPRSPWRLAAVVALPEFCLELTFRDGTTGIVDMAALIFSAQAGVFAELRDPAVFSTVRLDAGAPVWPNEIDLAPDALYDGVRNSGGRVYRL